VLGCKVLLTVYGFVWMIVMAFLQVDVVQSPAFETLRDNFRSIAALVQYIMVMYLHLYFLRPYILRSNFYWKYLEGKPLVQSQGVYASYMRSARILIR